MSDVLAGIGNTFADKLLSSVSYPLIIHVDGSRELASDTSAATFPDDDLLTSDESSLEAEQVGDDLVDVTIDCFIELLKASDGRVKSMNAGEKALFDLFDGSLEGETIELPDGTTKKIVDLTEDDIEDLEDESREKVGSRGLGKLWKKIKGKLKSVADKFVKAFQKFLKDHFKFQVLWTEVRINRQPQATVGNPIKLEGIDAHVRAKITACIKLFGKWRCAPGLTLPWIHVSVGTANYRFWEDSKIVYGKPSVENFDIIISVTVFGKTFTISIGVTGLINKQLDKQKADKLYELKDLEIKVDTLGRKFTADSASVGGSANGVWADVTGHFVPA